MDFTGKVVIITGASSGLGWALAEAYTALGARVGVLARREDRLRELCATIVQSGGTCAFATADAMNQAQIQAALAQLTAILGPCDTLIANAGVGESNTSTDLNIAGAERVLRTNLFGVMYAFDAVLPSMLARGQGHLVGISSMAAYKGLPTAAAYCASKAGLNNYLESIRISLRSKNIAVTTICQGFIRTPMTAKNPNMLWVLEPAVAARKIVQAIHRRKKVYSFPKRMRMLMSLTRWFPDWLIAKAIPEPTP